MVSVAIIDIIGLTYDGDTLNHRGLGGSESAVVLMSRELAKLGFNVTVFNNCIDTSSSPGVYDHVTYMDLSQIETLDNPVFDIVISSRTVVPFLNPALWQQFADLRPQRFQAIKNNAKFKAVWMHDTFCRGDEHLEGMLTHHDIDEIFTLSDFHTSYVANCNHGQRRMFEVMKRFVFMTRNGVTNYNIEVDIANKDPNLYIYNASVSKGMIPLVTDIWPKIKQSLPNAKLKVIGGYYIFGKNAKPDAQEKEWRDLVADPKHAKLDIEFTGIIKQSEIAEILSKSSYMIFPGKFPETFGISTLESLLYNTPLITTRFGALEETAVEQACYLIDYPIEPNGLFPTVNKSTQVDKFVDTVVRANYDKYLHQQKMYYCNIVKDICTWDTVALQWKQHLYKKLGLYMSIDEYRKVSAINAKVHQVFGRRFTNPEEHYIPRGPEQRIVVVSPMYNAAPYIERCIDSVVSQDYSNYHMYIIDDCSTDNTVEVAQRYIDSLPPKLVDRVTLIRNEDNRGAVYNQINTIIEHCDSDNIVMLLDGDDSLVNDNQIFHSYNNIYDGSTEFTYGSCWSLADNIPLVAQPYPEAVKRTKSYRQHKFNWNIPYTHLRTFKASLLDNIPESAFKDSEGNWYKAGGDGAVFYSLIEQADPSKVKAISNIVYNYNDKSPLNDYKVNGDEQTRNATMIVNQAAVTHVKEDKIDGIGPWVWQKDDFGGWYHPKKDWEEGIRDAITMYVPNKKVVVQAGGCQGMYPRLLSEMFDEVYTFEPHPSNYEVLIENCKSKTNIVAHNAALGAYQKKVGLIKPQHDNAGGVQVRDGSSVDMMTIDDLNLTECSFIQLDVERYEMFALMGAMKTIEKFKPIISLEGPETTNNVCNRILEQIGYDVIERVGFDTFFRYTGRPAPHGPIEFESNKQKKKILIAIPTAKNIETKTFKTLYDLIIPDGYEAELQFFYGYQVDQVRNLIGDWAKRYDYLFAVDSDMAFPPNTLERLLGHNKDVVSGLYIQRKPGQHILEIYRNGRNVPLADLQGHPLQEIDGCGFGCVLVKGEVFRTVPYPHFVYKSAIDHSNTVSEDTYFCLKAKEHGFKIFADTTIRCEHIGSTSFTV